MSASRVGLRPSNPLSVLVRGLAHDAHLLLAGEAESGTVEDLLVRIDEAILQAGEPGRTPIARWLEGLRREVEMTQWPVGTA